MRIVVTGGSGNVGTALLRCLAGSGRHHVVGVSRRRPPDVPPYDAAEWVCVDVGAKDAIPALRDAFAGADAVVHLAWAISPSHDRDRRRRTNQNGTAAVVAAVRAAGVGHLVHQSSVGSYAPGPGRTVDESWPVTGIETSSYSVDKAAAEVIVARAED
jgi:nucleoside-diphosphate-sugar epimerase